MGDNSSIIPYLFAFTLLVVLLIGIYQFMKVKRSRREHHHSVGELQDRGDKPKTYGSGDTTSGSTR